MREGIGVKAYEVMHQRGPIDKLTKDLVAEYWTVSADRIASDDLIKTLSHRIFAGAETLNSCPTCHTTQTLASLPHTPYCSAMAIDSRSLL